MGFLPADYKEPSSSSRYMQLEDGVNKIRVLSEPVMGWVYWTEEEGKRKPTRTKDFLQVPIEYRASKDNRNKAKYFWAVLVWNYNSEAAQLLELTQTTIRSAIATLDSDPDWGDCREYDLVITKKGKDLETEYQVNPKPKSKFDAKGREIPQVKLEALFDGNDPFDVTVVTEKEAKELANDPELNKILNGDLDLDSAKS